MANENRSKSYRPPEPYGRPQQPAPQAGGDPLAELARLIGQQNDSYGQQPHGQPASYGSNGASGYGQVAHDPYQAQQSPQDPYQNHQAYDSRQDSSQFYDQSYAATDPYRPQGDMFAQNDGRQYSDQQVPAQYYGDSRYAANVPLNGGYDSDPRHAPQYDASHGAPAQAAYPAPSFGQSSHNGQGYADPNFGAAPYSAPSYGDQQYGAPPFGPADTQQQFGYGQEPFAQGAYGQDGQAYDDPYRQELPRGAQSQGDDQAPARRRGGLVTVIAVLVLAVVGTGGAFGYRAMFGSSGTRMPPPVIKADTAPSKVVPAATDSSKQIQDRIGAGQERMITREEQPVDINGATRAGPPRVVFPNLSAGQGTAQVGSPSLASAQQASGSSEPKKVRTVAIRPDQQGLSEVPRGSPQQRNANALADTTQATGSNAPISLAPNAAPSRPTRTASAPAAAVPAATTGAYGVQVSSQRSESDAQAAYRSLQTRFPAVLGDRQPVIKRADLGDKGTYYRAQVPFNSQSEASEFCTSLKTAGGQCVVQRN